MDKLVSVIVTVFEVELYLRRCIESIMNQTYKNLEIILVNDGSPDKSGEICNEYALKDHRIKVLHNNNEGASGARNAGLEIASGDYFSIIDGDDWLHKDFIYRLYDLLESRDADVSVCDFIRTFQDDIHLDLINEEVYEFTKIEILELLECLNHRNRTGVVVPWNKLYKRELFNEVRYPLGKVHNDEFTTYKLLYKADKIVLTNQPLYFYRQRTGSISSGKGSLKNMMHAIEAFEQRGDFYNSAGLREISSKAYWNAFIYYQWIFRNIIEFENPTKKNIDNNYKILIKKISINKKNLSFKIYSAILNFSPFAANLFYCYYQTLKRYWLGL